jgi:hypothetical protein
MELVQVKILGTAMTAQYGTLSTGDVLRTNAEFAKHLVEDCHVAEYTKATATKGDLEATAAPKKGTAKKGAAETAVVPDAAMKTEE